MTPCEEAYKTGPVHVRVIKQVACGIPDPPGKQIVSSLVHDAKVIHIC